MKKLKLSNGYTGFFNDRGEWRCTGSQMGRRNVLPTSDHPKLRLQRLPLVDGCYDRGGAYWGHPNNLWVAWDDEGAQIFKRADSREQAKEKIVN